MARKLALTLIVAGAIITLISGLNFKNAIGIAEKIRNEPKYSQLTRTERNLKIAEDPRTKMNEPYAGISAALTLASIGSVNAGIYLSIKRDYIKNYLS